MVVGGTFRRVPGTFRYISLPGFGGSPGCGGSGLLFEFCILHNDSDALQVHCVICNVEHFRVENVAYTPERETFLYSRLVEFEAP